MSLGVPLIVSRTKVDMFYYDDSLVKFFESENESDSAEDCMLLLWRDQRLRARLATNASRYIWESGWQEKQHGYLRMVQALASPYQRQNA